MSAWTLLGWLGNACFFSRFLVQWLLSERAGQSLAPRVFWWLSLAGSAALGVYTLAEAHYVLLVGCVLNGLIYARNLRLRPGVGRSRHGSEVLVLAGAAALALAAAALLSLRTDPEVVPAWLACAGVGQAIWSTRFVVQWVASERAGESHFPRMFWWLSLVGNALLLAYTIHLGDAVLIVGYVPGPIVQLRNLALARRQAPARAGGGSSAPARGQADAPQLVLPAADVVAGENGRELRRSLRGELRR